MIADRALQVGTALALLAGSVWPLTTVPMLRAHDTYPHTSMTVAVVDALKSGVFPLPTVPILNGGMGSASILYHCPAAYYAAAFLTLAGLPLFTAFRVLLGLGLTLSFTGMLLWARRRLGAWPGLLAAAAFLYAPYVVGNVYWRFALPEVLGLALLPCSLWLLDVYTSGGRRIAGMAAAATLALQMMLHPPSTLMALPLIGLYGLAATGANAARAGRLAAVVAAAFSLGAAYWLPAQIDQPWLNVSAAAQAADYHAHFYAFPQLLGDQWSASTSVGGPLRLARPTVVLLFWGLFALPVARSRTGPPLRLYVVLAGFAAAALCMIGAFSAPVWEALPSLKPILFPWRWLGPASLALAFLAPAGPAAVAQWLLDPLPGAGTGPDPARRRAGTVMVFLPLVAMQGVTGMYWCQAVPYLQPPWSPAAIRAAVADVPYFPYLPHGTPRPQVAVERRARILEGPGVVVSTVAIPGRIHVQVVNKGSVLVEIPAFWYREWEAKVDGLPVTLARHPISGAMLVRAPRGMHEIVVAFRWPRVRLLGLVTGALALAFLAVPCAWTAVPWAVGAAALGVVLAGSSPALSPAHRLERARLSADAGDWPGYRYWLDRLSGAGGEAGRTARELWLAESRGGWQEHTFERPGWTGKVRSETIGTLWTTCTQPKWCAFTGRLQVDCAGEHRFWLWSDDGAYLFIDGHVVVDNGHTHSPRLASGGMTLSRGEHEVVVAWYNDRLSGEVRAIAVPPSGFPEVLGPARMRAAAVEWLPAALAVARGLEK